MIHSTFAANTIRLAKVTYVHPEGQKLEVMFLDTGDYGRDVQVMSPYAGTDFGFTSGIPAPEEEGHDPNKETDPDKRHIIAVIATVQGRHICLGFLFPQITHMAFTKDQDKNRLLERHTSDFYRTVDDEANMEMVHPSGAFVIMSENSQPTNLDGRDFDNRWELKRNTGKQISIRAQVGNSFVSVRNGEVLAQAGASRVKITPAEIEITAPIIKINGNILHMGNNTQFGAHLDGLGNTPHTA